MFDLDLRMQSRVIALVLVAACGRDPDASPDAVALLGEAQIGIGRDHDPAWVTHLGGDGDDQGEGLAIAADAIYVGGDTSSAWFGPFTDACAATGDHEGKDCADAFLVNATTGAGVQFGQPQSDSVKSLAVDDGGLYVAAKFREDAAAGYQTDGALLKYALDLQTRAWDIPIRNAGKVDELLSVVVEGQVYASGGSAGQVGAARFGDEDMVVMGVTMDGAIAAVTQLGGTKFEEMMGVAADAEGVYAVGQTSNGLEGAYLGGSTDAFLVILDRDLAGEQCRVQIGTDLKDVAQTVVVIGAFVYIGGYTEGSLNGACNQDSAPPTDEFKNDAWLAKFDKACQQVWTRVFGTKDGDATSKLATDGTHVFAAGIYGSASVTHGGPTDSTHGFVRAYDLEGNVTGEVRFDSGSMDIGQSVAVDGGKVHVTGATDGTLGPPGSSLGGRDVFLAGIPVAELTSGVSTSGTGCP